MSDRKGDPAKQPKECKIREPAGTCPHIKETGGSFEGERYDCDVCGEYFFLDYEDMK